jgi:hypothetical protein
MSSRFIKINPHCNQQSDLPASAAADNQVLAGIDMQTQGFYGNSFGAI